MDDDDDEREWMIRHTLESNAERNIRKEFDDWLHELFAQGAPTSAYDPRFADIRTPQQLRAAIERGIITATDLGTNVAFTQLANVGIQFDWFLVNEAAREFARARIGTLIQGIEETTRTAVREAIARWIDSGSALPALVDELAGSAFSERRARLIAQTETTRAFADANLNAYQESGVVQQVEWRAAADERVCPVCGRLHRRRVRLGELFEGTHWPPAHPGCRCWVVPVVDSPAAPDAKG